MGLSPAPGVALHSTAGQGWYTWADTWWLDTTSSQSKLRSSRSTHWVMKETTDIRLTYEFGKVLGEFGKVLGEWASPSPSLPLCPL